MKPRHFAPLVLLAGAGGFALLFPGLLRHEVTVVVEGSLARSARLALVDEDEVTTHRMAVALDGPSLPWVLDLAEGPRELRGEISCPEGVRTLQPHPFEAEEGLRLRVDADASCR